MFNSLLFFKSPREVGLFKYGYIVIFRNIDSLAMSS